MPHTLGIWDDLIGGETRIRSAYGTLTPAEIFFTPVELRPGLSTPLIGLPMRLFYPLSTSAP